MDAPQIEDYDENPQQAKKIKNLHERDKELALNTFQAIYDTKAKALN